MDILKNIDTNVSSMVSSSFDEYISKKVNEAVEKEKEKFLADLNMCEEEFLIFDETKHKKFEACKLVNDNSLLYQTEPRRTQVINNNEYILKNIKIKNCLVNIPESQKNEYLITNKGNIYVKPFSNYLKSNTHKHILFNYKVLEYLNTPKCVGQALKREIVNGSWFIKGLMDKNDIIKNAHNAHTSFCKKDVIKLSERVCGCGCGYNSGTGSVAFRLTQPELYAHYEDHIGWREDCIERFLTNNICPDCRSGEISPEKLDPDINIEIFRNPPIFNVEYIELLELLSKKDITIPIYQIQTIYAKYHPRANENFVIEEKLKKLTQIEKVVEERVEEEKNELQKQKEIYLEKIKQVNEEKLKRIFSMFILRNERKENIKDKSTIREMIKRSNEKCKNKEQEQEINLEKQRNDFNSEKSEFEKEKEQLYEDKIEYENYFKSKVKSLLDMANDINEINELQDDTLCKSEELFSIMKRLNEFI
tara:strand:- start:1105 stop:2535 length:1431 start_codon:yes stop_codon:yes gene_type:complete